MTTVTSNSAIHRAALDFLLLAHYFAPALSFDAVDRDAIVFLPPSYGRDRTRRYPVVYALHGYSIGAEQWTHEIHVPQTIEGAFAKGVKEMIVERETPVRSIDNRFTIPTC